MEHTGLARDWAFKPALDPELKRYVLLAYLQRVGSRFAERKLYPHLEELRAHVAELLRVRTDMERLERSLSGDLIGFDAANGQAVHAAPGSDPWLAMVDEIINESLPRVQDALMHGVELREEITARIRFAPVGVLPLVTHEGWLLLRTNLETRVYTYAAPFLRKPDPSAANDHVRTHYVTSYPTGITYTFERIKTHLIDDHRTWPNPAVFAFETDLGIPHIETFMPLAKQLVYEVIGLRA